MALGTTLALEGITMSTYRVNLYRTGQLISICMVRATSAAAATALLATNNPDCEAIGEG